MAKKGFLDKAEIPGIKKIILENGIKVFLERLPHHEKMIFLVSVGAGSRDDPKELQGLCHFVEHIQFHSNPFRTADEITDDLEDSGTDIDAATDFDSTTFQALGYAKYFSKTSRIIYEALNNFNYNDDDIEREKEEIITELKKDLDSPEEHYFSQLFLPALLRRTFCDRPILGTPKTLQRITKDDLVSFKKKFYAPENMAIFICGNFDEEKALKAAERTFGRMKKKNFEPLERKLSLWNRRREIFKRRKGMKLAYMALGYKVPGFNHRDCAKLILLDSILSSGMSSRLWKKLKREKGIGYALGSQYDDFGGIGIFYARLDGVDALRLKEAKEIILNEFEDLKTNLVSKREFIRAKNLFFSDYDDNLEALEERASLVSDAYYHRDVFDCRNLRSAIENVSREALRRAAQKYFRNNYTLTALVPENFEIKSNGPNGS